MEELGDQCKVVFAGYFWNQMGNRVGEGKRRTKQPFSPHTHLPSFAGGIRDK
jgi:hypothetical protein